MNSASILQQRIIATKETTNLSERRWRRLVAPMVLLTGAISLRVAAGKNPQLVERYYSHGAYLNISRGLAFINKFFSFSVAEILALMIFGGLIGGTIWQARQLYLRRAKVRDLAFPTLRGLLWTVSLGAMLFLILWGLNYQRQPLAQSLNLRSRPIRGAELEAISRAIVAEINRNYEAGDPRTDPRAASSLPLDREELFEVLKASFEQLAPLLGGPSDGGFGPPKPVYLSRLMSRLSISGMYSPFTGEPNFNSEQPDSGLPFAIAHEMAHQRGYAREDEADFIAFLVCINSSDRYVRYSGHLHSMNVLQVLARLAPGRYQEVLDCLGPGPRVDINASNSFWSRYQGKLRRATFGVTDTYLKINQVKSGMKNYDEVTTLIISYYLKQQTEKPLP